MTKPENIKIVNVPIAELKPATYNPRKWEPEAIEQLTESMQKFGIVDPIIANIAPRRKGVVIGGHFRLKIAKDLGYKAVPVVFINIPDIEKEKELNLRLNKNTGEWDWDLLKDFNIEQLMDVGFSDDDLSYMWDDVTSLEEDNFNIKRAVDEIKIAESQRGEIYQLGSHRLMCGDSTKPEELEKLMGGGLADVIYSDPPYNIGLDYSKGISTAGKYKGIFKGNKQRKNGNQKFPDLKYKGYKQNDRKKVAEYRQFLDLTLKAAIQFLKPNAHVFYWCDENYIHVMQDVFQENEIMLRRVCLWIKNNFNMTPQIAFNKVYEPCVYGTRGEPYLSKGINNLNELLNREIESGNQVQDEILEMINIWMAKRDAAQDYEHPTQKPLSLHEKPLKRCTKPGDLIVDLFGGSGSTLIACEQLKRRAYLMEIDPVFVDVIIKRYEAFTNKRAEKVVSLDSGREGAPQGNPASQIKQKNG